MDRQTMVNQMTKIPFSIYENLTFNGLKEEIKKITDKKFKTKKEALAFLKQVIDEAEQIRQKDITDFQNKYFKFDFHDLLALAKTYTPEDAAEIIFLRLTNGIDQEKWNEFQKYINYETVNPKYLTIDGRWKFTNEDGTSINLNNGIYSDNTIIKTKMGELNKILRLISTKHPELNNWIIEFKKRLVLGQDTTEKEISLSHYGAFLYPLRKYITQREEEKINYRNDSERVIDADAVLTWAESIIKDAATSEVPYKQWHGLSLALSLTSGRRPQEIHGTTKFSAKDSKYLISTGLAKKRNPEAKKVTPCLVDTELWLKALDNMPKERRGLDSDSKTVNHVIRKAIDESSAYKKFLRFGFQKQYEARAFFINFHLDRLPAEYKRKPEVYLKNIIGHENANSVASYTRFSTLPIH